MVFLLVIVGFGGAPAVNMTQAQSTSWTLMFYMADDTTSTLSWQDDLNEMEAAQQASSTNAIALVDPYGPGNSVLYKVAPDPNWLNPTIVSSVVNDSGDVISGGEVNMADPVTLSAFINFSTDSYPAERYVLVLWGHGAGWRGLCPDGADVLSITELGDALAQSTAVLGRPLDLVAVDSCAEAGLETMTQIQPYARLLLASEKDVPFQGLPYADVMNNLEGQSGQSVGSYASSVAYDYVATSASATDYSVTMGVFDLTKVGQLLQSLSELSVQGAKYDPLFNRALKDAFNGSESYEEPNAVDFMHFVSQLQKADLPLEIKYRAIQCELNARALVEDFQKYDNPNPVNHVHVSNASGFTIFAPGNSSQDASYAGLKLASTSWYEFGKLLRNDTATILNGPGPTVEYWSTEPGHVEPGIDGATLAWTNGTICDSAWIFRNQSGDLVLLSILHPSVSFLTVHGIPGRLTLATSTYVNGSLASYWIVNLKLNGTVWIQVNVTRDGQLVSGATYEYELRLVISANDGQSTVTKSPATTYADYFAIRIPGEGEIGDHAVVHVLDRSTGEVIGAKNVLVPEEWAYVDVDVTRTNENPYGLVVPLLFAILPGLLILGFAISLHIQKRRRESPPAKPS